MTTNPKTFLVFGGVGGIGGDLVSLLHSHGHTVYATTRTPQPTNELPIPADRLLNVDVLNASSIAEAVRTASQERLDGLAYCIGTINLKPLGRTTADDIVNAMLVNTVGAFLAIKEASAVLSKYHGSVVLFSSIAATKGFVNHAAIASAKAALEGLARTVAAELAPHVRVNVIAPSLTDTPLARVFTQNAKMSEAIAAMHPIPRLGIAAEMAKMAAFLLSDESGWITGQTIHIDGGRSTIHK